MFLRPWFQDKRLRSSEAKTESCRRRPLKPSLNICLGCCLGVKISCNTTPNSKYRFSPSLPFSPSSFSPLSLSLPSFLLLHLILSVFHSVLLLTIASLSLSSYLFLSHFFSLGSRSLCVCLNYPNSIHESFPYIHLSIPFFYLYHSL